MKKIQIIRAFLIYFSVSLAIVLIASVEAAEGKVAIFRGKGASAKGITAVSTLMKEMKGIEFEIVTGEQVRDGKLSDFDAVIFVGGGAKRQAGALEEAGRSKVIEFIEQGGGYVGICAGAYLAGSGMKDYLGFVKLKHDQPWAKGKGYVDVELSEAGQKIFEKPASEAKFRVRYGNGPIYVPNASGNSDFAKAGLTPLAYFRQAVKPESEVMVDKAAILAGRQGKGRFILISPHPETLGDDHCNWMFTKSLELVLSKD